MAKRISVKAPEIAPDQPEYPVACKSAIEPSVTKLLDLAADAGWEPKQVALALMYIAASLASDEADAGRQDAARSEA